MLDAAFALRYDRAVAMDDMAAIWGDSEKPEGKPHHLDDLLDEIEGTEGTDVVVLPGENSNIYEMKAFVDRVNALM